MYFPISFHTKVKERTYTRNKVHETKRRLTELMMMSFNQKLLLLAFVAMTMTVFSATSVAATKHDDADDTLAPVRRLVEEVQTEVDLARKFSK